MKLKFNLVESIVAGVLAVGLLVLVGLGKIHLESALAFIGGTLIPVVQKKVGDDVQ